MEELYDLESVYDEQISPLMKQIINICKENKMPMVCSFAFENCAERGVGACTTVLNDFDGRFHKEYSQALKSINGGGGFFTAMTIMTGKKDGRDGK